MNIFEFLLAMGFWQWVGFILVCMCFSNAVRHVADYVLEAIRRWSGQQPATTGGVAIFSDDEIIRLFESPKVAAALKKAIEMTGRNPA